VAWAFHPAVTTWRLDPPPGARTSGTLYLKVASTQFFPPLTQEVARMKWAHRHLPVPEVVEDGTRWAPPYLLVTEIPGLNAASAEFRSDPRRLVVALAEALRRFHETPTAECPFDFTLGPSLDLARKRVEGGFVLPEEDFGEQFRHLTAEGALAELESSVPDSEDLVVCHGDYCMPNVLMEEGPHPGDPWRVTGFVDLGEVGVADRWWDLATALWSLDSNIGPGWQERFLEAYGAQMDHGRARFYRLLYEVVS
jgi:aminoglycoside phosphotransferase